MTTTTKPKIYLFCQPIQGWGGANDVIGRALAEDGEPLASHLSSGVGYSQHDMGLTSKWKHEIYAKKYPEGFELVWLDDPDHDEGFRRAVALHDERAEAVS